MDKKRDYSEKFAKIIPQTFYARLSDGEQEQVKRLAFSLLFSQQELRIFIEALIDLQMWQEPDLFAWWQAEESQEDLPARSLKKKRFKALELLLADLRHQEKVYASGLNRLKRPYALNMVAEETRGKIAGLCPVASEKTVCCNLRTIDTVQNCGFGCSYCSIRSFYPEGKIIFAKNLRHHLAQISIDPTRYYHFGSGQSSDALLWGNKHGVFDDLFWFAANNPNILLELKTKSNNVQWLNELVPPPNVVISWSLNPDIIIENEEHWTANLEERLAAARQVVMRGVKVGFHFHPIFYFKGWQDAYQAVVAKVLAQFKAADVLFISFGSLTFSKAGMQRLRGSRIMSKALQMEMVPNPEGKHTYPKAVKVEQFRFLYHLFNAWHNQVFFYLCMEEAYFWEAVFGQCYPSNAAFEQSFGDWVGRKVPLDFKSSPCKKENTP